jgi:hypothetical protein
MIQIQSIAHNCMPVCHTLQFCFNDLWPLHQHQFYSNSFSIIRLINPKEKKFQRRYFHEELNSSLMHHRWDVIGYRINWRKSVSFMRFLSWCKVRLKNPFHLLHILEQALCSSWSYPKTFRFSRSMNDMPKKRRKTAFTISDLSIWTSTTIVC